MKAVIETPRGAVFPTKNGQASLVWNTDFRSRWQKRYSLAQRYLDSEVLRTCEPYVPLLTGMLIKSGMVGTDIGSGEVAWIAPYAKAQYYSARKPGSTTGPLRGPQWFERAKAEYKHDWIRGAARITGRG